MYVLSTMRIRARLIMSFLLCVVLMAAIGVFGYVGTGQIQKQVRTLNEIRIPALDYLMETDRDLQQLLVAERSMIYSTAGSEQFQVLVDAYEENLGQAAERWEKYKVLAATEVELLTIPQYEAARSEWEPLSRAIVDGRIADTREGRRLAIDLSLGQAAQSFDAMREHLNTLQEINLGLSASTQAESESVYAQTVVVLLSIVGGGLLIAIALAFLITASITSPLKVVSATAAEISKGNFTMEAVQVKGRDELARLAGEFNTMNDSLRQKADAIRIMARGDFSVSAPRASDVDGLADSLEEMNGALNQVLGGVRVAVDQVTSGATQIAQSSQSLSQGASEQASSLEEISSSLAEISSQSKQNAENATEANVLASEAVANAKDGNDKMKDLQSAMEQINVSSDEVAKVVKVIDDIAFQINLLALNANVEAARAGKYGKGFAVVADEVRNLAVRSAAAVKETTGMVDETLRNIEQGTSAAKITAEQLDNIVSGSSKVAEYLGDIAVASKEQAAGFAQTNSGLEQIDQVTQSNTASAEESASAAEELAAQAHQLNSMVARFKLTGDAKGRERSLASSVPEPAATGSGGNSRRLIGSHAATAPTDPRKVIQLEGDDFS
jgi:methyl-accepting chemotaxis protein